MAKRSLKVRARFALVLVVLVPALLAVAGAGLYGLHSERNSAASLYTDHVLAAKSATDLGIRLGDAQAVTLTLLAGVGDRAQTALATTELSTNISTDIDVGISSVRAIAAGDPAEAAALKVIASGWSKLQQLRAKGSLSGVTPAARVTEVREVDSIFNSVTNAAKSIVQIESTQAKASYEQALDTYSSSAQLMFLVLIIGLAIAVGMVVWLIRSVLTRTLSYSEFANAVSEGDFSQHLSPRGDDELDHLGATLETLSRRRQAEERYDEAKVEFTDTLQLTESEQDAQDILRRYVERAIADCTVTIFNRNNSADRLEAVTVLADDSPLIRGLEGAKPRSCLSVRMARPFVSSDESDPLLACPVCSECTGRILCTPLLVGGEVIGSVLANHVAPLAGNEERSVREAVMQSAPVLGNLRNLAIAELRSATDALTGLPNRRAIEDTLKRMVAQSSRSVTPLAALMCDLDHFKIINDKFGHGSGDDLLAAVGAALSDTVRASDFVGRYGGEEFLILLPATSTDGAREIADRVRRAVTDIRVPSVPQNVTLSVGIAVVPDHAVDAGSLERAADRALYAAKNAGRDRIEVFGADDPTLGSPPGAVARNGRGDPSTLVQNQS